MRFRFFSFKKRPFRKKNAAKVLSFSFFIYICSKFLNYGRTSRPFCMKITNPLNSFHL